MLLVKETRPSQSPAVTKLQRSRREALEADNFWSGRKSLCSLTVIPRQVIPPKTFLQLTFLVIRKISRLICEQGCKNEKLVITKFSNCLQTPNSVFRPNANKASVRFKRLPYSTNYRTVKHQPGSVSVHPY